MIFYGRLFRYCRYIASILLFVIVRGGMADSSCCHFPLQKYMPAQVVNHALDILPNCYLNYGNRETGWYDTSNLSDNTAKHLSAGLYVRYSPYVNTDIWQVNGINRLNGSLSLRHDKRNSQYHQYEAIISESNSFTPHLSVEFFNQLSYYLYQGYFLALEVNEDIRIQSSRTKDPLDHRIDVTYDDSLQSVFQKDTYLSINQDYSGAEFISIGKGRVEDVTFAAVALQIFDKIDDLNLLKKVPEKKDIQAFSRFLHERKKRRVFDTRKGVIDDVSALTAYLEQQGFLEKVSPELVMEIDDQWNYAFTQERRSGVRGDGGLWVMRHYNYNEYENEKKDYRAPNSEKTEENFEELFYQDSPEDSNFESVADLRSSEYIGFGTFFKARFHYEKPLNRFFQTGLLIEAFAGTYKDEYVELRKHSNYTGVKDSTEVELRLAGAKARYDFSWYPNTRTDFTLGTEFNYTGASYANDSLENSVLINPIVDFSASYYLSPRLRLSGSLVMDYMDITGDSNLLHVNKSNYSLSSGMSAYQYSGYELEELNMSLALRVTWAVF